MHRVLSRGFVIALLLSGVAFAQSQAGDSLGDIARANRANRQAQDASGTTPKVITNQDLPAGSKEVPQSDTSDPMSQVSGVAKSDRKADQRLSNRLQAEQHTAEQWRARIEEQENRIADLQARIERVNASMNKAVGTAEYDTPVNRYQMMQAERLAMMQQNLEQQKRRLEIMQGAARRAGMDQ